MGRLLVVLGVLGVSLSLPPTASAHPLGNFTINQFSQITVGTDDVRIAHVLDMAEIPTVSERQRIDTDDDDELSESETDAWLAVVVPQLIGDLALEIDGEPMALIPASDARLTFPDGQAGLPTLRLELDLATPRSTGRMSGVFRNSGFADRTGWREIVVVGAPGVAVTESSVPAVSVSDALRAYPDAGLDDPIDVREATFSVRPDAGVPAGSPASDGAAGNRGTDPFASLLIGGAASPSAALLAILVSLGLGAAHAASPGHGKTLVAAYLIGARGTPSHALTLGLTVAMTHTVGVFVLGAIVLGASELLVPDRVVEWLSLIAGVIVIGMGLALVIGAARAQGRVHGHDHAHAPAHAHAQGHDHDHDHDHAPLTRRSVAIIGLAGGLVPSASALIVLLVAVSQGQLALGIVLIAAFGVGMSLVLGGIGLAVVLARRRVEDGGYRFLAHPRLARIGRAMPRASAMAVLVIGIVLTVAAVGRIP